MSEKIQNLIDNQTEYLKEVHRVKSEVEKMVTDYIAFHNEIYGIEGNKL